MRLKQTSAILTALLLAIGCRRPYTVPETPMPPNTILLSGMMRNLSEKHPELTQTLVDQIDRSGKKGPALLTPDLIRELRKRILGKDWQGLDRFPGWTMRAINPTVRVATRVVARNSKLEGMAAVHPGAPAEPLTGQQAREFLDLGPYGIEKAEDISLDEPSSLPPFTLKGNVTPLGYGVVRGDGPNALAPEHGESQRLADVLNRLAVNGLDGSQPFTVSLRGEKVTTPKDLVIALEKTGHTVTVVDARYFANFGHFHYNGQDVMMPFWINTRLAVPGTGGVFGIGARPLLIPVSHAEYEWRIRGPRINADVSHYFGIDGKAEWRTMDTLDQPWVLRREAHVYRDAQAAEVTRLATLLTLAFMHQHARSPTLPFGGYYTLGVCQDGVSAIERKMTGRVTLFPNTADAALFDDPRDAEVNAMMAAIPKDREGAPPQPERIFGSLPTADFNSITIPGLAADVNATYAAWQKGDLHRTRGWLFGLTVYGGTVLALIGIGAFALARRKR
jgi:hypothetical protein